MSAWSELLRHGRGRVLLFCLAGWVFDFFDLILFAFVKVQVASDLELSLTGHIAVVDGATLFATAFGGLAFGRLGDRVGRRRALTLSILCYAAGAGATAFAEGYGSLLLARALTGLGVGGEWGIGHAIVAETFPGDQRDRAHAILQAGSPLAMALAAAVGCFAAPAFGWRVCYLAAALPALLVFAARWALPGDDRAPGRSGGSLRELWSPRHRRPAAALLLLLTLHMTGFWCVYAWLPTALQQQANATPQQVGWFQIAINSVHIAADVGFGFLAARYGRVRMLVTFCLVFAAGQALVAWRLPSLLGDATFTVAIALMGVGAGTWSCFGALFGQHFPEQVRATAASASYSLARGVQLPSQLLMGQLFLWTNSFAPALWVGAACALASALAAGLLPRAPRRPPI